MPFWAWVAEQNSMDNSGNNHSNLNEDLVIGPPIYTTSRTRMVDATFPCLGTGTSAMTSYFTEKSENWRSCTNKLSFQSELDEVSCDFLNRL